MNIVFPGTENIVVAYSLFYMFILSQDMYFLGTILQNGARNGIGFGILNI